MAEKPITVTWDDLSSRKVETRLKEQNALARNREYAQMDETALPQAAVAQPGVLTRLWRNSVFAMALFGLLGGLAAWACGASLQFRSDVKADADARMQEIHRLTEAGEKDPAFQADADVAIESITAAGRQSNPYFAILSDPRYNDPSLDAEKNLRLGEVVAQDRLKGFIRNILAYGAAGVMIALFLAIALPVTEKNLSAVVINGSVGAALGLIGGVVVSLFVDGIYQKVAASRIGPNEQTQQLLARLAVWGTMGLFLTVAPGVVMRNWKKFLIGMLGGLIGGLIGGVLYDPVFAMTRDPRIATLRLPELSAMLAIGLFAGLATGVIENAAKTGWLRVTAGLIAGKQFILYRNPTFVGSGPDCQIYLFKDPKVGRRHAAIHIVPGGFELEDLPLGESTLVNGRAVARTRLKNGDRVQIGATSLVFQEKAPAA